VGDIGIDLMILLKGILEKHDVILCNEQSPITYFWTFSAV